MLTNAGKKLTETQLAGELSTSSYHTSTVHSKDVK